MSLTKVPSLQRSAHKTQIWLTDLSSRGHLDDEQQAYSLLRAVLHALRDRLTIDEAASFAAQLPMIVRGIFYEGWKPAATPIKYKDRDQFYQRVRDELRERSNIDVVHGTEAVFALLAAKLTEGEMSSVRELMPEDLRLLWPSPAAKAGERPRA